MLIYTNVPGLLAFWRLNPNNYKAYVGISPIPNMLTPTNKHRMNKATSKAKK